MPLVACCLLLLSLEEMYVLFSADSHVCVQSCLLMIVCEACTEYS